MENEADAKIPLLEDLETPVEVSADSIYPVKNKHGKCKKGRCIKKCLKILCKAALVAFLIFGAIAAVVGYRWHRFVAHQVQKWTVTEPNPLPVQKDVPMEELEMLKDSAILFWDSIQYDKVPEDFALTQRDLNGFFALDDHTRGNIFADMKKNEYQVSVSMPTDGLPGGKGRFFVATKTIAWDPENQELKVKVQPLDETMGTMVEAVLKLTTMDDGKTLSLEVVSGEGFGKAIPQEFIDEHYNLLEDLYKCDCHDEDCKQARKFVEGLAGVSMEDGQVVVHADPEPTESKYYKYHEGHSWHHGHHHHGHHGKHDGHHGKGDHHHGGHHHRRLRAKFGRHHHMKALHMVRKLMAY